ncbi:DMT family transporter [Candidatus Mycobacterium methanotrophicum]|uniref:DMT family transporter n=1 Tax=Candidatus Mycobacterium methanotrophicum TaxID=2943498 RepID=A0ABY4QK28_9MYCO|nr:DMT family transporter [Candidatus Mycobacterium methanotrophicum]UQX10158.1 DMT family transporter [Candidatus Mycobacterium methanotrophicum]
MSKADFAALIALCAALASAVGDVVRQRSAQEVTDKPVGHLELFHLSLRDVRWWLGGAGAVANYSLQAAALALGSVILVTALQVTSLLFALPIYARLAHHRVTRWEWIWAVVLAAALAVVVVVGDPSAGDSRGSLGSWVVVAVVMGPILVLCVVGARIWSGGPAAPVLLAVVAGSSLALFAVLTKGAVGAVSGGFGALLRAPETYALVPAALVGMIFQQSSFRAGALTASLPAVTVAKPTVASLLGILVLKETLDADGPELFALVAAAIVVIVSTIALARGEAASIAAGAGRDVVAVVDGVAAKP